MTIQNTNHHQLDCLFKSVFRLRTNKSAKCWWRVDFTNKMPVVRKAFSCYDIILRSLIFRNSLTPTTAQVADIYLTRCYYALDLLGSWTFIQQADRRLTVRSREASKPRDWMFQWSHRSGIRRASRQRCCRGACQISRDWKSNLTASRLLEVLR